MKDRLLDIMTTYALRAAAVKILMSPEQVFPGHMSRCVILTIFTNPGDPLNLHLPRTVGKSVLSITL